MIKYFNDYNFMFIIIHNNFLIIDFEIENVLKDDIIQLIKEDKKEQLIRINCSFNINLDQILFNEKSELGLFGRKDKIMNFFDIVLKLLSKRNDFIDFYWIENSKKIIKFILETIILLNEKGLLYKDNKKIKKLNFSLLLEFLDIDKIKEIKNIINENENLLKDEEIIKELNLILSNYNTPLFTSLNYYMQYMIKDFFNFMIKNFKEVEAIEITEEEKKEIINYFNF